MEEGEGPAADRTVRLHAAIDSAGLQVQGEPVLVTSHSNDAWLINDSRLGECVLRICWRGDRLRLLRESAVGRRLPAEVGYPTVLAAGSVHDRLLSWSLTRRLPGRSLLDAWPAMDDDERRRAASDLSDMIKALHGWRPPADLADRLLPTEIASTDARKIGGASINPLPLQRLRPMVDDVRSRPGIDQAMLDDCWASLNANAALLPALDDRRTGIIHGDLHLQNVWSDGHRVTGLLDLEWVRLAPPYVDLARMIDEAEVDELEGISAHRFVLTCWRETYPAVYKVDQLELRVRLCRLAYHVRELSLWSPPADFRTLPPDHPQQMIKRLLER